MRSLSNSQPGAESSASEDSGSSISPTFTMKSSGATSSTSSRSPSASADGASEKRGLAAIADLVFCYKRKRDGV